MWRIGFFHTVNMRQPWAARQEPRKCLYCRLLTTGNDLHSPVCKVPYPPEDPNVARVPRHPPPKAHTLDPARD